MKLSWNSVNACLLLHTVGFRVGRDILRLRYSILGLYTSSANINMFVTHAWFAHSDRLTKCDLRRRYNRGIFYKARGSRTQNDLIMSITHSPSAWLLSPTESRKNTPKCAFFFFLREVFLWNTGSFWIAPIWWVNLRLSMYNNIFSCVGNRIPLRKAARCTEMTMKL